MYPKLLFILFSLCISCVCTAQSADFRVPAGLFPPLSIDLRSHYVQVSNDFSSDTGHSMDWPSAVLPPDLALRSMALFCRMEVKLERAAAFPVKFRLGTVDYVDRLEQKPFVSPW